MKNERFSSGRKIIMKKKNSEEWEKDLTQDINPQ
jgi:hypothetical protein